MRENIIEIFSSIQGEGKYVGCRQVFVRLEGCNLDCAYCDTENEIGRHPCCMVEEGAGTHALVPHENPLSVEMVAEIVARLVGDVPHHSLSITGGEPLLHVPFIKELTAHIDLPVFLETNGTLHEEMASLLDVITYVSMDIKLPSVTGRSLWETHRRFLHLLRDHDAYVKIVVAENTGEEEFQEAVQLMRNAAPHLLLVLQPVTPFGGLCAPSARKLLRLQARAAEHLSQVRVIPQAHRMMGLL